MNHRTTRESRLLNLQSTWFGWITPSHITTAAGQRCPGAWAPELRPNPEDGTLKVRLSCPACGAQHIYSTAGYIQQATSSAASGYGQAHLDLAGLRLWPGRAGVDGKPIEYLVTRPDVERPVRIEVIGELRHDPETEGWDAFTRPEEHEVPRAEQAQITWLSSSLNRETLTDAAEWIAGRRRRTLDAETIRRLAQRTPWWGCAPCAVCADDHEIHDWLIVDRYDLTTLECDRADQVTAA